MAIITHQPFAVKDLVDLQGVRIRVWANMANGDEGDPIILTKYNDRTIQVSGDFGVGGTLALEGSNDGTTWLAMRDVFNAPVTATAAKLITLTEVPVYVRPRVTAGNGATSLTVTAAAVGRE